MKLGHKVHIWCRTKVSWSAQNLSLLWGSMGREGNIEPPKMGICNRLRNYIHNLAETSSQSSSPKMYKSVSTASKYALIQGIYGRGKGWFWPAKIRTCKFPLCTFYPSFICQTSQLPSCTCFEWAKADIAVLCTCRGPFTSTLFQFHLSEKYPIGSFKDWSTTTEAPAMATRWRTRTGLMPWCTDDDLRRPHALKV